MRDYALGVLLLPGAILGLAGGIFFGQPLIGTVAGTGIAALVAVIVALR